MSRKLLERFTPFPFVFHHLSRQFSKSKSVFDDFEHIGETSCWHKQSIVMNTSLNKKSKPKSRRTSQASKFRCLTFLGTSSAQPIPMKRNVSSMVIQNTSGSLYMIDCGEATQHQLKLSTLRVSKLHSIFITHCHGDHCYGLFGLLHSLPARWNSKDDENENNKDDHVLHIYGPIGIKKMIESVLSVSGGWQHYPLTIHELQIPSMKEQCNWATVNEKKNNKTENTIDGTNEWRNKSNTMSMEIESDNEDVTNTSAGTTTNTNNNSDDNNKQSEENMRRKMSFDDDMDEHSSNKTEKSENDDCANGNDLSNGNHDKNNDNNNSNNDNNENNDDNNNRSKNDFDNLTQCHIIHDASNIESFFHETRNNQLGLSNNDACCYDDSNHDIVYNNKQLGWNSVEKYNCNEIIYLGEIENGIHGYACPITHRVPTFGYVFVESDTIGKLDAKKAKELGAVGKQMGLLKNGENVTLDDGRIILSKDVIGPSSKGKKIAIMQDCSDCRSCFDIAKNCDILVHECTYQNEFHDLAIGRGHSTASMAANAAVNTQAKMLVLTHFSSRYVEESETLNAVAAHMNKKSNDNNDNDKNDNKNGSNMEKKDDGKEDFEDFLCVQELAREAKTTLKEGGNENCVVRCAADFMTFLWNSKQQRFIVEPQLSIQGSKQAYFTHDIHYLKMIEKENETNKEINSNINDNNKKIAKCDNDMIDID